MTNTFGVVLPPQCPYCRSRHERLTIKGYANGRTIVRYCCCDCMADFDVSCVVCVKCDKPLYRYGIEYLWHDVDLSSVLCEDGYRHALLT